MKAKILLLFIALILALCFFACNPYKRVATDVNRTDKNKALLLNTCLSTFPPLPPTYIKGKDSIYTQHDTAYQTVIEVRNDTIYKTQFKTITVTNTITRTDTFTRENTFAIAKINSDLRICEKEADKLTNANEVLKTESEKWKLWFIVLVCVDCIAIFGYILIKLK
jgi:hypothetical protein